MLPRPRSVSRSARWVEDFSRRRSLHPGAVYAVGGFGVAVTGLHFASMGLFLYSKIWWWDVMVHALSGLGVAAVLYVYRPRLARGPFAVFVVLPLLVLAIGTWFEVYERLFTDFWVNWSRSFYLHDTGIDLVADTAGAVVFSALIWGRAWLQRRRGRPRL
ncbi:hypothetical protein [Salinigranum salinum]|uniref:hypothetical protein n=1 Tax=Salinigranum salinum TaxID=1364937 RepID=UPI00374349A9